MSYCVTICPSCGSATPRSFGTKLCPTCAVGVRAKTQHHLPNGIALLARPQPPPEKSAPEIPGHAVHETIGTGGMGSIHRARQGNLQRDVALKISLPERTKVEDRDRFLREARVLAQLDHPNIVPVYDFGRDADGRCFYTMKMVRGRTLKAILIAIRDGAENAWTLERLLEVFRKVCDAIAFAHARGVIHRDLKPENIMVGEFGEVLVVDWGLAGEIKGDAPRPMPYANSAPQEERERAIDANVDLTMEGEVVGTPQYMSPEQASACTDLDERSDIYALGGILYTILTLRPPVRKSQIDEMLASVRTGKIEPFEAASQFPQARTTPWRIPPALAAVVRKAMALEREDRFQTTSALAGDVEAYLAGYATSAQDINLAGQLWLFIKRHRVVSVALLVLLIVSAQFVVRLAASERLATHNAHAAQQNALLAVHNAGVADRNAQLARQSAANARTALAQSNVALADSLYSTDDPARMRAALDDVPADLRDTTWHYLDTRADERQSLLEFEHDGFLIGSVPHPTRPGVFTVATGADKHRIVDFDVKTGKVLRSFDQRGGWVRGIAYSPDGKLIALSRISGDGISIHRAEDGVELRYWKAGWADSVEFLPDGKRLLQSDHIGCYMWNAATGGMIWKSGQGMTHLLLPGGERIAAVGEKDLSILSAEDGHILTTWPIKPCIPISASISPDGSQLVVAYQEGLLATFRLSDGTLLYETPAGENGNVVRTAFTTDGLRIVTIATIREGAQIMQVRDAATGRALRILHGGVGGVESMCFHPLSGDLLVTCARSATWALPKNREPQWTMVRGGFENGYVGGCIGGFVGGDDLFIGPDGSQTISVFDFTKKISAWHPSHSGEYAAASSADGRTGVMEIGTAHDHHNEFLVFRADGEGVHPGVTFNFTADARSLALNCDGSRVAVCSAWGTVGTYLTEDGRQLPAPEQDDLRSSYMAAWHGTDARRLIGLFTTGGRRGMADAQEWIFAWDTDTGRRVASVRNASPMNCLATEPGGTRVAVGGDDKLVRIRDADSLAILREFRAHDGSLNAIAWNPKRPIIATGSADRSVRLWNADTGEMIEELHIGLREPEGLYFSPSGNRLACVIPGEKTLIWEVPQVDAKPILTAKAPVETGDEHGTTR